VNFASMDRPVAGNKAYNIEKYALAKGRGSKF
jgi:hypothetical protein